MSTCPLIDAAGDGPPTIMRQAVAALLAAAVTVTSYLSWLGWHEKKYVVPGTSSEQGPYEAWQVNRTGDHARRGRCPRRMGLVRCGDSLRDHAGGDADVLPAYAETHWETTGNMFPMDATIDSVGRLVVPKPLRDALGLTAGSTVDISRYGAGLQLVPTGRTARLVEEAGVLVAAGETEIDDDVVFGLIDTGRR